jgi:hypothetical protein
MKKSRILGVLALALVGIFALKVIAAEVVPASVQLACYRDSGSSAAVTNVTFYQGDTLSLTNSVMYSDATGAATQNLDGCVIDIVVGQPGNTNTTTTTGIVMVAASGTFSADFTLPAFNPCYIQVSVSNNAVFTYPLYRVTTQAKLGE